MTNLINNRLNVGETIYDNTEAKEVEITKANINKYRFGVIHYNKDTKEFILGFYQKDPTREKMVRISLGFMAPLMPGVLKDELIYINESGLYRPKKEKESQEELIRRAGTGNFPYIIERLYEAQDHLKEFAKMPSIPSKFPKKYKKLLKYTFGVEYETTMGYIPQEDCYKYGLIPVRDGSISGIEYASAVLDNTDGLEKIQKHIELLNKYTSFDKNCSYHIHMGGFPVEPDAIFSLYSIWSIIAEELKPYLPDWAFNTSNFKSSQKEYCRVNPDKFISFKELYVYISEGRSFSGSLIEPHPRDPDKKAKWNIRQRYWAQSLIGMCFFKGPKTVEYRMLAPTSSFEKLLFWIYMFNAIMLYAEKVTQKLKKSKSLVLQIYKSNPTISTMLREVYPIELVYNMEKMMATLKEVVDKQRELGDLTGEEVDLENKMIKGSIFN